jgi:hypothetical protein
VNCADVAIESSVKGDASAFITSLKNISVANLPGYPQNVHREGDIGENAMGSGPSAQDIEANSGPKRNETYTRNRQDTKSNASYTMSAPKTFWKYCVVLTHLFGYLKCYCSYSSS